jgi:ribosomal protein S18 acetylase RimI-like enzyme
VLDTTHIDVVTWRDASVPRRERFRAWVESMEPERDGELGPGPYGAMAWVERQHGGLASGGVYGTFLFFVSTTGEMVATVSFVSDDRDVGRVHGLDGLGFLAFLNVRHDLRGQKLGSHVCWFLDRHVQSFVDRARDQRLVYLFTNNPIAVRLYKSMGFVFAQKVEVPPFGSEDLYSKNYRAADRER